MLNLWPNNSILKILSYKFTGIKIQRYTKSDLLVITNTNTHKKFPQNLEQPKFPRIPSWLNES